MKDYTIPMKLIKIMADGSFYSGEDLGKIVGMSRSAINKHIITIRGLGIDIITVTRKGYVFSESMELLDEEKINSLVDGGYVAVFPIIDSTNQYLLTRLDSLSSGDACLAEYQYAGRGRRGRKWFSPFGTNLYLSLYWRLEQGPAAAIGVSVAIGIVMAEVLQSMGAEGVRVKWPNDLYLHDRKLAGILVELNGRTGDVANLVIGIGINLKMAKSNTEVINQRWINLQEAGVDIDRNTLSSTLINELRSALALFECQGLEPFVSRWRTLDNYYNRDIKLIIGDKEIYGIDRGINGQGALLLEQNGDIVPYVGGEISLRGV